jgi:outer membrane protein assembly factor BamB/nitrous oxidase accessory protein NosD
VGNTTITKNNYITVSIPPNVTSNLNSGTYSTSQTVTLTSDDPTSIIYYANDTTDPRTSSTRMKYTGPISIDKTTTLRFAAVDNYGNWSILYIQNYVIGSTGNSDAQNTGLSNYTGPEVNTTLWNYTTGGSIEAVQFSPVIGADGTIYMGNCDGKLYALNPDGSVKWTYTTGDKACGIALGSDGTIYVAGGFDNSLHALNTDGTLKWKYKTRGNILGTPTVGPDGTIYVGSCDSNLYALNPDGTLKWNYTTEYLVKGLNGGPAIGPDGTIYVESGGDFGKLYALNPDGTLKWYYLVGEYTEVSPTVSPDGTIYVSGYDNTLYALNPNGTPKWNYFTGGSTSYSPVGGSAIGTDGTIYFGNYNGIFFALNPDGTQKWNYTIGQRVCGSPFIGSDGTIYVGSYDGKMYALSVNGTLLWTYTTGGAIYGSATIGANGTLYFGSSDKNVYAIANTVCRANQTAGAAPLTVQFNASDISPDSWSWDFGDGNSSTDQNPIHTYLNPGFYNVTLTVTRSNGQKRTVRFTNYIKVYNAPVSCFTANTNWGAVPGSTPAVYNNIQFSDTSANIPTSWLWDFGDGTTSTLQNPTHAYTSVGDYIVTLTVINPAGNNTFYYPIQVMGTISANSTLPAGTYNNTQTATLTSDDPAATIYYTNDTTDPRTSSSKVKYTGPITISKTTTLRYAAVTSIGKWSPLYLINYVIGTGGLTNSSNPTYQGNNNHTGQSEYNGLQNNTTNTKWNNSNINLSGDASVTIGADGTIYISDSGCLYALFPNGIIQWIYYGGSTPTLGKDGTIYTIANNYLQALKPDGTSKWEYYIIGVTSPIIGADGTIYVASYDNSGFLEPALYAINPNGTLQWNTTLANTSFIYGNLAIGSDGTIYVPGHSFLYAVNPDGTIHWTYAFADHQATSPSIGPDGTIYIIASSGSSWRDPTFLYAINSNGTLQWTYTTQRANAGSAAIGSDGTIYLLNGGSLIAINPNGTQKWNCTVTAGSSYSPLIGADGTIYCGLSAVSPDGIVKWNCTSISVTSNPVIDSDGTMYIGTTAGLYAFRSIVANFNYTIGSNPLVVQFNDTSTNATTWKWNFGDGTNSTLQNPTHTYIKSGQYLVTLEALTPEGILTAAQMITINDITSPTVIISPNGGDFNTTFNVTLNANDDSGIQTVYYTTDGSDPRTSNTRGIYTDPLSITDTVTIKYAAVDSSGNWSPVYQETYTKSEAISGVVVYIQDASYYTGSLNDAIQAILDNAASGSNIVFLGQLYDNLHLVINKQLNLISNVGTKISLSDSAPVFLINGTQASGTTIKGFTIINTGTGSGITVNNTNNVTISNDQISSTCGTAVLVNGSSNTTIRSSSIHDSTTGISISGSAGTQVNESNIYNNDNGVSIENNENTTISLNQITGNTKNGVAVSNSNNTTINGNNIKKNGNTTTNGSGIYLENSTNINIDNNQINENFYGITANNITNAFISNSSLINNARDGILLTTAVKNVTIYGNTIQNNDNGINVNCFNEDLTISTNLITESVRKVSGRRPYHGNGVLLGENYKHSSTFLIEHNILRNSENLDFQSCGAAGIYIRGSNWMGSYCKKVYYDPQMSMNLLKTGEKEFTVVFRDGLTGKIVNGLPRFTATFRNGAYSKTAEFNDDRATTTFQQLANGEILVNILGITTSIPYNEIITDLGGSSNGGSDKPGSDNGQGNGSGTGTGTGTGSGSGAGSGSSGSASSLGTVAATAALEGSGSSSGQSGSNSESCSQCVQELFVDDKTSSKVWSIIGIIGLLILVLGVYYRADLITMIKKSKK